MGRVALALVGAVRSLLGATACGERSEPTGPDAHLYPGDGAERRPPARRHRPGQAHRRPRPVGPGDPRGTRRRVADRRVSPGRDGSDLRALRRAHPDLIVAGEDAERARPVPGRLGDQSQVYTAPGDSIRQVERAITQLGLLTGAPVQARTLVGRIEARRRAGRRPPRPCRRRQRLRRHRLPEHRPRPVADRRRAPRGARRRTSPETAAEAGPVDIRDLLRLDPRGLPGHVGRGGDARWILRRNPQTRKLRASRATAASRSPTRTCSSPARGSATGLPAGRPPAPPGCVSLSSTPSPSTATARSSGSSTRCPLSTRAARARRRARGRDAIRAAFAAEVAYYRPDALHGRDPETLAALRLECTRVFLEAAGAELEPGVVRGRVHGVDRVRADPGAIETVADLRARGLELARRLELGRRPRRAPRADSALASLFSAHRHDRGGRRRRSPTRRSSGSRSSGSASSRRGRCTSATSPGTRRARAAAGMRFAPAPLATAFEGWA